MPKQIGALNVPLVHVVWMDSAGCPNWDWPDEKPRPLYVQSVGFLLVKNAKVVQIVQSRDENGKIMHELVIPLACVVSIKRIPLAKAKKR